jgi:hypothetical protein
LRLRHHILTQFACERLRLAEVSKTTVLHND